MSGGPQDRRRHGRIGSAPAVDFHPDLDALGGSIVAQFVQRAAEVLNRGFLRNAARKPHRLNLDSDGACIMREIHELLCYVDLLLALRRIWRLKSAGGAVADKPYLAPLEKPTHPETLFLADGGLNSMFMPRPQLDAFETGALQHADNRF